MGSERAAHGREFPPRASRTPFSHIGSRFYAALPALLCSLVLILASSHSAMAQEDPPPAPAGFAGLDLLIAQPTGEFAENVDSGFGVGLWGRLPFDPAGLISLRADLGFLNYGNETIQICITTPCRVTGELTTSNNIFFGGVGPELGVGSGAARLFVNAEIGFAYFATTSSVGGIDNNEDFARDTNFDDLSFAWTAGGGGAFRLSSGATPVYLTLGARYHGNGEAEYLREGDIVDNPDGSIELNPQRSDTNLWTFQLGVSLGFGVPTGS